MIIENSYALSDRRRRDPRSSLTIVSESGSVVRHFAASDCFRLEVEQFNRAIEGKGEPMTTPEEGLRALAVAAALYQAIGTGRVAKVAEFLPAPAA